MFCSQETHSSTPSTAEDGNRSKSTFVHKLLHREISGGALYRNTKPFGQSVPERLVMKMETIIPAFALENGHIFMGFTNCNRYLLSYTIRPSENFDSLYSRSDIAFYYKLHFWLFTPYKPVKRVSSVLLFDNNGTQDNNLLIQMTGWEGDDTRVIVTGRSSSPERGGYRSLLYVTVTTVPLTKPCSECQLYKQPIHLLSGDHHAQSDGPRAGCLRHGLTAHSVVDRVEPFPKFCPEIQLSLKDTLILNTGNSFHVLTYKSSQPETAGLYPPRKTRSLRCDFWFKNQPIPKLFSNCTDREASRIHHLSFSDLEEERNRCSIYAQEALLSILPMFGPVVQIESRSRRRHSQSSVDSESGSRWSLSTELSQSTAESSQVEEEPLLPPKSPPKRSQSQLLQMQPPTGRKFFKTGLKNQSSLLMAGTYRHAKSPPASQGTYDIFEVSPEEVLLDRSLSSYRRRRNADKEYEFTEPDRSSENILPLKLSRCRKGLTSNVNELNPSPRIEPYHDSGFPRSPRTIPSPAMSPGLELLPDILRPLTNNSVLSPNSVGSGSSSPFWENMMSETKASGKSKSSSPAPKEDPNSVPSFSTHLNCIGQVLRSYIEKEDDSSSIRTDTDDESGALPFPVALNLEVHGPAYQALQLVSNSKVKGYVVPKFQVLQQTLDIELICNEVSGMICLASDKHFTSCFDYDVAIVHVCPERGSVTALAVVLIQATSLKFRASSRYANYNTEIPPIPGIPDPRKKYEGLFSFVWEPTEERARILYVGNLLEIDVIPEKWNPTKYILPKLLPSPSGVRTLTNDLVVYEWQSLDELTDSAGIVTLARTCTTPPASNSPFNAYNFASPMSSSTEDEDLSD